VGEHVDQVEGGHTQHQSTKRPRVAPCDYDASALVHAFSGPSEGGTEGGCQIRNFLADVVKECVQWVPDDPTTMSHRYGQQLPNIELTPQLLANYPKECAPYKEKGMEMMLGCSIEIRRRQLINFAGFVTGVERAVKTVQSLPNTDTFGDLDSLWLQFKEDEVECELGCALVVVLKDFDANRENTYAAERKIGTKLLPPQQGEYDPTMDHKVGYDA
jgi:hypothetical protein